MCLFIAHLLICNMAKTYFVQRWVLKNLKSTINYCYQSLVTRKEYKVYLIYQTISLLYFFFKIFAHLLKEFGESLLCTKMGFKNLKSTINYCYQSLVTRKEYKVYLIYQTINLL